MPTVSLANGKTFPAPRTDTILEAAGRGGVVLEQGCSDGRCGACRTRLIAGTTTTALPEAALTLEESGAGWILPCVRRAETDVELDAVDLTGIRLPPVRTLPARIRDITRIASEVMVITLRLPPRERLDFEPGQHVELISPMGVKRRYSIANAPREDATLELHLRRVEGGEMSDYVFERAAVGDLLRLRGPFGTFQLGRDLGEDLVLLATGTGIAPIRAMIEDLLARPAGQCPSSLSLYWGARHEDDLYWRPNDPRVKFVPVLSRGDVNWSGARGHVQNVLLAERGVSPETVVFACGSASMVNSARVVLRDAGLSPYGYRFEVFTVS